MLYVCMYVCIYQLDGKHPVHQMPQEIKDKWSAAVRMHIHIHTLPTYYLFQHTKIYTHIHTYSQSREQAKGLAKAALQKTLADISMGKNEWEFYSHTRHVSLKHCHTSWLFVLACIAVYIHVCMIVCIFYHTRLWKIKLLNMYVCVWIYAYIHTFNIHTYIHT